MRMSCRRGAYARAGLALLRARGVNVLVLDEPTNHLDLPAIEQLEQALESYDGTLLLVTHDRRMLATVQTDRHSRIEAGEVTELQVVEQSEARRTPSNRLAVGASAPAASYRASADPSLPGCGPCPWRPGLSACGRDLLGCRSRRRGDLSLRPRREGALRRGQCFPVFGVGEQRMPDLGFQLLHRRVRARRAGYRGHQRPAESARLRPRVRQTVSVRPASHGTLRPSARSA